MTTGVPAVAAIGPVTETVLIYLFAAVLLGIVLLGAVRERVFYRNFGVGGDGPSPDELTNCPSCGARVPRAEATCEHCDEPLDGGEPVDDHG